MLRAAIILALLSGLLTLSSCAESLHQRLRGTDALGIPPELEKQIDTSVSFAQLKAAADNYNGRIVAVGGIVLAAKRTKERTEIEILQIPSTGGEPSTKDRIRSEGRFLAVRNEFLDPASVPAGTPITVIGSVMGSVTRKLDETEYLYPVLEIKHVIDWAAVASQESEDSAPAYYSGAYYPPFGYWGGYYGSYPYWGWPYPYFIPPRSLPPPAPSPPPPAPPPRFRHR